MEIHPPVPGYGKFGQNRAFNRVLHLYSAGLSLRIQRIVNDLVDGLTSLGFHTETAMFNCNENGGNDCFDLITQCVSEPMADYETDGVSSNGLDHGGSAGDVEWEGGGGWSGSGCKSGVGAERSPNMSLDQQAYLSSQYIRESLDGLKLNLLISNPVTFRILLGLPVINLIVQYISRGAYDLVHCHDALGATVAMLAAAKTGIPVVVTLHNERESQRGKFMGQIEVISLLKKAGALVVVNDRLEKNLRSLVGHTRNLHRIGDGINLGRFLDELRHSSDVRHEFSVTKEQPMVVLAPGQVSVSEYLALFRAVAMETRGKRAVLVMVGHNSGDCLFKSLHTVASSVGIRLIAWDGERDWLSVLKGADVMVQMAPDADNSWYCLEAMACGVPVVIGESRDRENMVSCGAAFGYGGRTGVSLGDAVHLALNSDPLLRMKVIEKALLRVSNMCSHTNIAARYVDEVYRPCFDSM